MKRHLIQIDETIATLVTDFEYCGPAKEYVKEARGDILEYIRRDPEFETSLDPVTPSADAPEIVKKMASAGTSIGVGPMAAVAGAISEYVVERLRGLGATHVMFDNGGDIAMYLEQPVAVGIYAGKGNENWLGFEITRTGELLGVCTSSATVGHSLSLGTTDASVVVSTDPVLADAAATALGNAVTSPEPDHIANAMDNTMTDGVEGMMVVIGSTIGTCGSLPRIVHARVDSSLISRGEGVVY